MKNDTKMDPSIPRVAHITTVHKPTDNRIVRKECTSLVRAGIDVTLIAKATMGSERSGEVPLHPIRERSNRITRSLLGSVDVWRALREIKPDLIHVHDPELIPLAVIWRFVKGGAAVYDSHEDLPKQIRGKVYINSLLRGPAILLARALQRMADRCMSGVVAATPSISDNFSNENRVLVQNFPWREAYDSVYTEALPSTFTLGYVGAITRARGIKEMLQVAKDTDPPVRLVLAGPITDAGSPSLVHTGSEVDYLGVLDPDEVPRVLSQISVGLVILQPLPNHLDSQPTKLYEYMAAGRPFIASDFPAWIEKFGHFDCGVFVDPSDAGALRRAVQNLIDDGPRTSQMAARAREAVLENFVFETQVEKLLEFTGRLARSTRAYRKRRNESNTRSLSA